MSCAGAAVAGDAASSNPRSSAAPTPPRVVALYKPSVRHPPSRRALRASRRLTLRNDRGGRRTAPQPTVQSPACPPPTPPRVRRRALGAGRRTGRPLGGGGVAGELPRAPTVATCDCLRQRQGVSDTRHGCESGGRRGKGGREPRPPGTNGRAWTAIPSVGRPLNKLTQQRGPCGRKRDRREGAAAAGRQ